MNKLVVILKNEIIRDNNEKQSLLAQILNIVDSN